MLASVSAEWAALSSPSPQLQSDLTYAGFAVGSRGTNYCPTGSLQINSKADCQAAALKRNLFYGIEKNDASYPFGCYIEMAFGGQTVHFNEHNQGSAQSNSEPLCKQPGCAAPVYHIRPFVEAVLWHEKKIAIPPSSTWIAVTTALALLWGNTLVAAFLSLL